MKLRKGDSVIVTAGKYKGKTGTITAVVPEVNGVLIDGINVAKKHQKNVSKNKPAGIFEKIMPINASNVAILNPSKKNTPARIGYKIDDKGKKVRVIKQANNKEIK